MPAFDPKAAARFIADAHRQRTVYQNLPPEIAPSTVDEAYAAQEALRELWRPLYGELAGLKIATTTKVMQHLMGIDHPCGGMIYERRVHGSPASIRLGDYMHVVIECELAVRMARALPKKAAPYTREDVRAAVSVVMPAFELIEDRFADYRTTSALSLIADNAWNGGIVLGPATLLPAGLDLDGIGGTLRSNGREIHTGKTDDPLGSLAWLANQAVACGRSLRAGMAVITGSVITTVDIAPGERLDFGLDGLGSVSLTASP